MQLAAWAGGVPGSPCPQLSRHLGVNLRPWHLGLEEASVLSFYAWCLHFIV